VRITVLHNRSKEEVKQSVDRSFNDLFEGIVVLPLRFVEEQRTWQGNTLIFSLTAKIGLVSTPIKGTIDVTDRDITIDVDLGMLERLIPTTKAREVVSSRVRGLLK
jgi:putative polyhydroxyalkanoic acid system protein